MYTYTYIYIYIYRERERESAKHVISPLLRPVPHCLYESRDCCRRLWHTAAAICVSAELPNSSPVEPAREPRWAALVEPRGKAGMFVGMCPRRSLQRASHGATATGGISTEIKRSHKRSHKPHKQCSLTFFRKSHRTGGPDLGLSS